MAGVSEDTANGAMGNAGEASCLYVAGRTDPPPADSDVGSCIELFFRNVGSGGCGHDLRGAANAGFARGREPGHSTGRQLSLNQWKTGYLATYALCEALALFGLMHALFGGNLEASGLTISGGFILSVLLSAPSNQTTEL